MQSSRLDQPVKSSTLEQPAGFWPREARRQAEVWLSYQFGRRAADTCAARSRQASQPHQRLPTPPNRPPPTRAPNLPGRRQLPRRCVPRSRQCRWWRRWPRWSAAPPARRQWRWWWSVGRGSRQGRQWADASWVVRHQNASWVVCLVMQHSAQPAPQPTPYSTCLLHHGAAGAAHIAAIGLQSSGRGRPACSVVSQQRGAFWRGESTGPPRASGGCLAAAAAVGSSAAAGTTADKPSLPPGWPPWLLTCCAALGEPLALSPESLLMTCFTFCMLVGSECGVWQRQSGGDVGKVCVEVRAEWGAEAGSGLSAPSGG